MCTCFIQNRKKTIVGWNLDLLDMEYKVEESSDGVFIYCLDSTEGWMPLFGVNKRGDFVGMPTCWPYDNASDPKENDENIIKLTIDLLLLNKTFAEVKQITESKRISSIPGLTFMSFLTNKNGDLLEIVPGVGNLYYEKPDFMVLTNFSPFKMNKEMHPWMGLDRYNKANDILSNAKCDFDVTDAFNLLSDVSQTVCPTVVSMVYDATDNIVYWVVNRCYNDIKKRKLSF